MPEQDNDPSRRTLLAAERTWLAWWRSGIAASAAAVAVGAVVPQLIDGSKTPYILLGVGYALLSIAVFVGAGLRQRAVEVALRTGSYAPVNMSWVVVLTSAAVVLAIATLVVIVAQP